VLILYIYITLLFFIYFLLQKEVKINIFNIGYDYQYFSQHFFNIVMLVFNTKTRDCHRTNPLKTYLQKYEINGSRNTHYGLFQTQHISSVWVPRRAQRAGVGGETAFFRHRGGSKPAASARIFGFFH
jgi:cellulose synthase/poly-beta-1,6-N-acetylglucosamine synthase-like glycosyltransferase